VIHHLAFVRTHKSIVAVCSAPLRTRHPRFPTRFPFATTGRQRQHAAKPPMPQSNRAATRSLVRLRQPLAALVADMAARIGKAQRRLRPGDIRQKGVGDFVTAADVRAERRLRRELLRLLPAAGFLGEESDPAGLEHEFLWVVDPIDGTSNFARGLPHFAVSVALLQRGQPVLAAIHCQPEDATYTARLGAGAQRAGRRLRTPPGRLDDGAILGCQWFRGQQDLEFLQRLQGDGARIRTLGSTVTQLADVATGRLDGNVQEQGRIWDIAACCGGSAADARSTRSPHPCWVAGVTHVASLSPPGHAAGRPWDSSFTLVPLLHPRVGTASLPCGLSQPTSGFGVAEPARPCSDGPLEVFRRSDEEVDALCPVLRQPRGPAARDRLRARRHLPRSW
jgi:myo-inositol-1(or 4)-monophosphatase